MEEGNVKKNKLAIILVSVVALLAVVLFVCSFFMLKQAKKTKEEAKQMTLEALDETREEGKASDSQVVEPTETQDSVIAFEDADDNIFIIEEANIRTEPSTDAQVIETAPKSKLFKRTGISADWSRLEYNGQT